MFLGSVGKLLPFVHLVGREVHAGMPTAGLNAALLAAEVTRHVELNPALVDASGGEVAPAPVTLHQTDGRRGYDVTTPRTAWCYYNLLRYTGSAGGVRRVQRGGPGGGGGGGATHPRAGARPRPALGGDAPPRWEPRVRRSRSCANGPVPAAPACEAAGDAAPDLPERARRVTEALWEASGLRGPAAVVGLAGVPYAPVHLGHGYRGPAAAARSGRAAGGGGGRRAGHADHAAALVCRDLRHGFLAADQPPEDEDLLARNTPGWGAAIHIDTAAARELSLPVVDVGARGRGAHGRLERVFAPYAFETVPSWYGESRQTWYATERGPRWCTSGAQTGRVAPVVHLGGVGGALRGASRRPGRTAGAGADATARMGPAAVRTSPAGCCRCRHPGWRSASATFVPGTTGAVSGRR